MPEEMKNSKWWNYAEESVRDLMSESYGLLESEKQRISGGGARFHDYAYLVFPAAKAYEGFLKKMFLDLGLITNQQYFGEHFRIGRALSPNLPKRYRSGWVFEKLTRSCNGQDLPLEMWEVWKEARNRLFHFFPHHKEFIGLEEAEILLSKITGIMDKSLSGCGVNM